MLLTIEVDEETGKVTVDPGAARKQAAEEWDGNGVAGTLVKSVDERRFTLVVGYPALRADQAQAADGFRDFASPEAVEDAAWNYLQKSPRVGLWHSRGTDGAGTVTESYIYRGPDWHMTAADGSEQVIKAGDWLLGIVWNPETWKLIKNGRIRGVSMQGSAVRRQPSREALASLRG